MQTLDFALVSVIILYYKRRETIDETLASVLCQEYPHKEIILVDNHSEDDLRSVVAERGSEVKLIELPENSGACGGRNAAIREARGDILVFLDDDMSFESPFELRKVVQVLVEHASIHVVAFQICDPGTAQLRLREWCHPRYWKEFSESEFETHWFCEGASAFRREVFDVCGPYYEPLFYGPEGYDLAVRLLDNGFRILHSPQVRVGHRASKEGRTLQRQYYYFTRDYIWMAYKDHHLLSGLRFLLPKLLMMLYFTVRSRAYRPFLLGVWHGVKGLRQIHRDRTPISRATESYLAELEKWRPSWRIRLARHAKQPQI